MDDTIPTFAEVVADHRQREPRLYTKRRKASTLATLRRRYKVALQAHKVEVKQARVDEWLRIQKEAREQARGVVMRPNGDG